MKMKVLLYVREWNKDYFTDIISRMFNENNIVMYSDFKGLGDVWTGEFIYSKRESKFDMDEDKIRDICVRCRFLRTLPYEKAEDLVRRVYEGVSVLFLNQQFDLVFIPTIDCYTLDIIERVSKENDVPIISFVQNFIKGYSRFTLRGERIDLRRIISKEEVEHVIDLLSDSDYKPSYSLNKMINKKELLLRCIRNMVKFKVYTPIMIMFTRDKYNYRFNTVEDYNYFKIINSIRGAGYKLIKDIDWNSYDKYIYIPLHFSPEATVDYWCEDYNDAFYEDRVIELLYTASKNILLIIKEHPAMYGRRSRDFYKKIKMIPNAILIHPYESSNKLLEMVDTVGVHTGSVGVEALLRKKRVLCFTKNYYSDIHPNAYTVKCIKEDYMFTPICDYDNAKFVAELLDGVFPFKYTVGWNVRKESDNIDSIVKWCYYYYERKVGKK